MFVLIWSNNVEGVKKKKNYVVVLFSNEPYERFTIVALRSFSSLYRLWDDTGLNLFTWKVSGQFHACIPKH